MKTTNLEVQDQGSPSFPTILRWMWTGVVVALVLVGSGDSASADDWTQWRGSQRDGVWRETGIRSRFGAADVTPVWRQPVGTGYSSPTVAQGKVLMMDYDEAQKQESIRCFESKTGKPIWNHSYDCEYLIQYAAGPRAAVTIDGDYAYGLGAMGHLNCLNMKDGTVAWQQDLNETFQIESDKRMPIWGISCSPIVVGDLLIFQLGAKDAGVVAYDKRTGKLAWQALNDRGQYTSPILVRQNNRDVLVCWTGDNVVGLDPTSGQPFWQHPFRPTRMPIGVATPIVKGNRIFMTSFYDGGMMLEMSETEMTVRQLWHEVGANERVTKSIHSIIGTPLWIGDHIYGVDSHGQLRCIRASDGSRVWEDLTAVKQARWATIHLTPQGDKVWMYNEQGELMVARISVDGLQVFSRENILAPDQMRTQNRRGGVCWSHPAYAERCIFVRNDHELICIDLAESK